MRLVGVIAVLLMLALLPASATAATARVTQHPVDEPDDCPQAGVPCSYAVLEFVGAPGEANRVDVAAGGPERTFRIRDDGADIQPGPGCEPQGQRAVRCEIPAGMLYHELDLRAGDMGDEVTLSVEMLGVVRGQDGDDVIMGSTGTDYLVGGAGRDRVSGGDGADFFLEERANAPLAADTFDGGAGFDELDYTHRRGRVKVDLAQPTYPAGQRGEGDSLTAIESVRGGDGNDVLRAGSGRALLYGGPGKDRLHGSLGDDSLWAGEGDDRLYGEGGRDVLEGEEGSDGIVGGCDRDFMRGGPGRDRLYADDGYRDKLGGSSGVDFARFDQLDIVRNVERRRPRRVDACAL